jgi:hypothetical protein
VTPGEERDPRRAREYSPTALPSPVARFAAFAAVAVAGICGALIGWSVAELQCEGDCTTVSGLGAVGGALVAAGGVAVVAVLVLRAMGEWRRDLSGRE